jgi:hypothetical protein
MDPALTPYTRETARYTVPYSLLHAGTYNRALSKEPERLHFTGLKYPACSSCGIENEDKFINLTNSLTFMQAVENSGEYYSLDMDIWKLAETKTKTDDRGRVYLSRTLIGQEARVFVSDSDEDLVTCKNFVMLSKKHWTELRGIRGDRAGQPLEIKSNGDIWTSQKDKFVKVFLRVKHG